MPERCPRPGICVPQEVERLRQRGLFPLHQAPRLEPGGVGVRFECLAQLILLRIVHCRWRFQNDGWVRAIGKKLA